MAKNQPKPRTTLTLIGEDVELINSLKSQLEKQCDVKIPYIEIVRKALKHLQSAQ